MEEISKYFYRESYFTKGRDENGNNDIHKEINLFSKANNSETKSNKSDNSNSSNISNSEEMELYFAQVETIIPIDEKINNNAIYNIKIKSSLNFNEYWIKRCTLDDLIKFRNYLLKYSHSVINLPFPSKSWLRFLPYIGEKYDERNWDILLENKFYLDDFFKTICKDKEMYKLSGFMDFFAKPTKTSSSINLTFN